MSRCRNCGGDEDHWDSHGGMGWLGCEDAAGVPRDGQRACAACKEPVSSFYTHRCIIERGLSEVAQTLPAHMSDHKFRDPEDYRDHLPCSKCTPVEFEETYGAAAQEARAKIKLAIAVASALDDVARELHSAMTKFPPFNSAHEGYGVLLEEVDELWDEVKAKQGDRHLDDMRAEAVQVAAMAVRFMIDICTTEKVQK